MLDVYTLTIAVHVLLSTFVRGKRLFTPLNSKGHMALCRLLTGAILAHELMHGWLRLKGILPFITFHFIEHNL